MHHVQGLVPSPQAPLASASQASFTSECQTDDFALQIQHAVTLQSSIENRMKAVQEVVQISKLVHV
jgi:hypothetical protein